MPESETTKERRPKRTIWWWTGLFILGGVVLSNGLWRFWYNQLPPSPRNHAFHFVWQDYINNTPVREEDETLIFIVTNSQGYGWEVEPDEIYASHLAATRKERGEKVRVVNVSIPGARFHDIMVATAAARTVDATHLLMILSPRTVAESAPPKRAINTWTSQIYYMLNQPEISRVIPPEVRKEMTDIPMRISMVIGNVWPAWRNRSLTSALLAEYDLLKPFFEIRNTAFWFRIPTLRFNNPRRQRLPRVTPVIDPQRATALLDLAAASAPHVYWINMPIRINEHIKAETAWGELVERCESRGIATVDMLDAIPADAFYSQTHFNAEGHRLFAGKLDEVLP